MDDLHRRRLERGLAARQEELARAHLALVASLPASDDVLALDVWAHERGLPACADEARFFLHVGLLRLSLQGASDQIRAYVGNVIVQRDQNLEALATGAGLTGEAATDAALMVGLALTLMLAHRCLPVDLAEYTSRFLNLMDTPARPS